jgi:Spy/CpxP family protein refolding chaperone
MRSPIVKKWLMWGAILLTVINVASLVRIGYHRWSDGERREPYHVRAFERKLGLSEAQAQQMKALRDSLKVDIQPLRTQLNTRREAFYQLMMAPEPDRAAIERLQNEMDSLQVEIKRRVVEDMLAQKRILTPEQQREFFSMLKKRYSDERGQR